MFEINELGQQQINKVLQLVIGSSSQYKLDNHEFIKSVYKQHLKKGSLTPDQKEKLQRTVRFWLHTYGKLNKYYLTNKVNNIIRECPLPTDGLSVAPASKASKHVPKCKPVQNYLEPSTPSTHQLDQLSTPQLSSSLQPPSMLQPPAMPTPWHHPSSSTSLPTRSHANVPTKPLPLSSTSNQSQSMSMSLSAITSTAAMTNEQIIQAVVAEFPFGDFGKPFALLDDLLDLLKSRSTSQVQTNLVSQISTNSITIRPFQSSLIWAKWATIHDLFVKESVSSPISPYVLLELHPDKPISDEPVPTLTHRIFNHSPDNNHFVKISDYQRRSSQVVLSVGQYILLKFLP